MENCVKCGARLKPENNFFSAPSGGVLCSGCADLSAKKVKIENASIKLIRLFLKNKIENFTKISILEKDIINTKLIAGEMVKWIVG
jgi:hypothetical protein